MGLFGSMWFDMVRYGLMLFVVNNIKRRSPQTSAAHQTGDSPACCYRRASLKLYQTTKGTKQAQPLPPQTVAPHSFLNKM